MEQLCVHCPHHYTLSSVSFVKCSFALNIYFISLLYSSSLVSLFFFYFICRLHINKLTSNLRSVAKKLTSNLRSEAKKSFHFKESIDAATSSQRTELNYLHLETQTKQGWIPFTQWIYLLTGDSVVPYSMTFLNAVYVHLPSWMYTCSLFYECDWHQYIFCV